MFAVYHLSSALILERRPLSDRRQADGLPGSHYPGDSDQNHQVVQFFIHPGQFRRPSNSLRNLF